MPSFDDAAQCDRPDLSPSFLSETSLRRVQHNSQIWYTSAVAFKLKSLTSLESKSAMELAAEIADALNRDGLCAEATVHSLLLDTVWQNFTIQTFAPGWIHLKLNEIGLQEWLNFLCERLPTWEMRQSQQDVAGLNLARPFAAAYLTHSFTVLHTHARCCSLLRLGVQEQLIQLEQSESNFALWRLASPIDITWLDASCRFRCTHATEQRLIAQIIDVLDALGCTTHRTLLPDKLWHLSYHLSQAFQAFYAHCRIFGAMQTGDRALAQARLGLVFITQALLHRILQDWLHVSPPIEL